MDLPSYFADFLREIRPTRTSSTNSRGHTTLRDRLRDDPGLSGIYISDFLQGSYRRATAVRPKGEARSDVDVIVVTDLDRQSCTPQKRSMPSSPSWSSITKENTRSKAGQSESTSPTLPSTWWSHRHRHRRI